MCAFKPQDEQLKSPMVTPCDVAVRSCETVFQGLVQGSRLRHHVQDGYWRGRGGRLATACCSIIFTAVIREGA